MEQIGLVMISKRESDRLIVLINLALENKDFINESMRLDTIRLKSKFENIKYKGVLL